MFDKQNRFIIKDYQTKPTFSSFLPGIAGKLGVPLWCFYNNRGQGVCSFGVSDKDHAIMEFTPAHVAYRDVSRSGFRTFCKINNEYMELFTDNTDMHIGMSELEICCKQRGLSASAVYFGIPEERTAALARILTVKNISEVPLELELLDGMAAIVPYGLNNDFLKNMTQLSKAWMQCEDHEEGLAYFRVRASLEDGAVVREVKGGNFCLGITEDDTILKPIVQPSLVFGYDTSMSCARNFASHPLADIARQNQVTSNQFLCCFLPRSLTLKPGQSARIYALYAQAENKDTVRQLSQKISAQWMREKRMRAKELVDSLVNPISCETGNPVFDAYAKQTYLDNLLRGGAPVLLRSGEKKAPFHLYSRKHGDPEREYNYFSLGQEYYAQGNGNYRDVNQNRRCDVLFAPEIGDSNIRNFFDLIQTDGYNPLVILPSTYRLSEEKQILYAAECPEAKDLLSGEFTPGQLAMKAEDARMSHPEIEAYIARVICDSESEPNASFGEGYWCDHWTYNLDLIETYLTVYPEKKQSLLFDEGYCRWYDTKEFVNPRCKRYAVTENGLRQYYALDEQKKQSKTKWMHTLDGQEARSSLIEKLILLCAVKSATLDPEGMGIEMEGGRPGWYDALNGLPGLLGSSMAETCELARLLSFTAEALKEEKELRLYEEIFRLLSSVSGILSSQKDPYKRWDLVNTVKEQYRSETMTGFSGKRVSCAADTVGEMLRILEQAVLSGIEKAASHTNGLIPTYFAFQAKEYVQTEEGFMPTRLEAIPLPLFLEGPVRYLKLPHSDEAKRHVAALTKESGLYDRKLKMYKVNEGLNTVSYEAGRALAFTPGWLENESVWLHMEYKYLLELLKSGLYEEFSEAFRNAAIPFQDPARYGRSPLENVSFIASSANPDPVIHGQGFVSRLSGSTAEFIHMWQILFFGANPFRMVEDQLTLRFAPCLPDYLIPDSGIVKSVFLGHVQVEYRLGQLKQLMPGKTRPAAYTLIYSDAPADTVTSHFLPEPYSRDIRDGKVQKIFVAME